MGQRVQLSYTVTTVVATGEEEVTYSHTPEQYVAALRENEGEEFLVARGTCPDCFYQPGGPVNRGYLEQQERALLRPYSHYLECLCSTLARFQARRCWGHRDFNEMRDACCCYAYYYQYWGENPYLRAVTEAGLVRFLDTSGLPTMKESGLLVCPMRLEYNFPY